jgi:hypothetical protein
LLWRPACELAFSYVFIDRLIIQGTVEHDLPAFREAIIRVRAAAN